MKPRINCANCGVIKKACRAQDGKGPQGCPTANYKETVENVLTYYDDPAICEFARLASIQEGECYANREKKPYIMEPTKTRIVEIIEFAHKMRYKKLGLAFCGGLTREAAMVTEILEKNDFEVQSISCKVGGVPKERIGVKDHQKINIGNFEPMCNPISQAEILNEAQTDFNILLGLCVGHDSLFLKHIKGFTTVLAVKDRVTGHNPMAAIYTLGSYYQRLKKLEFGSDAEIKSRLTASKG